MRTAAYEVNVAMRPPQARVSQAKLYFTVIPGMDRITHINKKKNGSKKGI